MVSLITSNPAPCRGGLAPRGSAVETCPQESHGVLSEVVPQRSVSLCSEQSWLCAFAEILHESRGAVV